MMKATSWIFPDLSNKKMPIFLDLRSMNEVPQAILRRYARGKQTTDPPDTISDNRLMVECFRNLSFASIDTNFSINFFTNILNEDYFHICSLILESQYTNERKKEISESLNWHLMRGVLSIYSLMISGDTREFNIDLLVQCLILTKNADFITIISLIIKYFNSNETKIEIKPYMRFNAESVILGFIKSRKDPMIFSEKLQELIFTLSTKLIIYDIITSKTAYISNIFDYIFLDFAKYPPDTNRVKAVLDYAKYIVTNHDFSIPEKICNHFTYPNESLCEFTNKNLFEEGPFVELEISSAETQLSRLIPTEYVEIKTSLFAAQKLFESSNEILLSIHERMSSDNTFFWRFFFASMLLFFKDDPRYINREKLDNVVNLFDPKIIPHEIHEGVCADVNSALITVAVKAGLVRPAVALLDNVCPAVALQGVNVLYGMCLFENEWFDSYNDAVFVLGKLTSLFARTRQALLRSVMSPEDKQTLKRIRSVILHILMRVAQKKRKLFEMDGFGLSVFQLFFEDKSRVLAMQILEDWATPTPSANFFAAICSYISEFLTYEPSIGRSQVLSDLINILINVFDRAEAKVLYQTKFSLIFPSLLESGTDIWLVAHILLYSAFEAPIPPNIVSDFIQIYLSEGKDLSIIKKLTEIRPSFNAQTLHPAGILGIVLNQKELNKNLIDIYYNIAMTKFTPNDAENLRDSLFYEAITNRLFRELDTRLPLQYDIMTPLIERNFRKVEGVNNFCCAFRFDNTYKNVFHLIRFGVEGSEIFIKTANGKLIVVICLEGTKQNTYDTELTINPLIWTYFLFQVKPKKLTLTVGDQEKYELFFPQKYVFDSSNGVIVSWFPGSYDIALPWSLQAPPNFITSFDPILTNPPLSFLVSKCFLAPDDTSLFERVKTLLMTDTIENVTEALWRLKPNQNSVPILFSPDVLHRFDKELLIKIFQHYIESFSGKDWHFVSASVSLEKLIFLMESFEKYHEEDLPIKWDIALTYTKYLMNKFTFGTIAMLAGKPESDYFDFVRRCCNEIPQFASAFSDDQAFKAMMQVLLDCPKIEVNIEAINLFHHISSASSTVIDVTHSMVYSMECVLAITNGEEVPSELPLSIKGAGHFRTHTPIAMKSKSENLIRSYDNLKSPPMVLLNELSNERFEEVPLSVLFHLSSDSLQIFDHAKLQNTIAQLISQSPKGFCGPMLPFFVLATQYLEDDDEVLISACKAIAKNAPEILQCQNWVFWLLCLATLLPSAEDWADVFANACVGLDMLQTTIWLIFLMKIGPFYDIDCDVFTSQVLQKLLLTHISPELFTIALYFLMYNPSRKPSRSPRKIAAAIAEYRLDTAFALELRVCMFPRLAFDLASSLLAIPPEVFIQGQAGAVSNIEIAALIAAMLQEPIPVDACLLYSRVMTVASMVSEEETKLCDDIVRDRMSANAALKASFYQGGASREEEVRTRVKDMVDGRYAILRANGLQTTPLLHFDTFCQTIRSNPSLYRKTVEKRLSDFNLRRKLTN